MEQLKIALLGYGKMGREIEKQALEQGVEIACTIDNEAEWHSKRNELKKADVAIEFSSPHSVLANIEKCLREGVAIVVGTTGWHNHLDHLKNMVVDNDGAFLYASNFSIGVNIFFELNRRLAQMMQKTTGYIPQMEEIHHTAKLDAPSGTAISLANDLIEFTPGLNAWVNQATDNPQELSIISKRIEQVPGTHIVSYTSPIDQIEIKHTAFSRAGFASGALLAAHWLKGKKGFFTMNDVLNF